MEFALASKSNKASIYANYLAKFRAERPNMVAPIIVEGWDAIDPILALTRDPAARLHSHTGRWATGVARTHILADGRVVEINQVQGTACTRYTLALWANERDWMTYERPQPMCSYFGSW
jgi:hypothetical protein